MNESFDIELRNFQRDNLEKKLGEAEIMFSDLMDDYVACKGLGKDKEFLHELKRDLNNKYIELNTLSMGLYGKEYFKTDYRSDK